ncbi:hypothetical protein [Cryobacterium melibiosiphilum]|uniref:hypothetical protein n=1 Tax=Cryobacterium melibiosiphilum TaxID=995039 RepID=UPI001313FAF5
MDTGDVVPQKVARRLAEEVKKLDLPRADKRLPPFVNMLRDVDKENFLEIGHHILSQQVHVTHSSVTSFVSPGKDNFQTKYDQDYGCQCQAAYVVAASCMFVRWVVARPTNDTALCARWP